MIEQSVGDVMTRSVRTVTPETTGGTVARLFAEHNIGCVVVIHSEAGNPTGIVTQSDIMQQVAAKTEMDSVRVDSFMSTPLITVTTTEDIFTAATLMKDQSIRRLPVIDEGNLMGILTAADLTDYLPRLRYTISQGRNELVNY